MGINPSLTPAGVVASSTMPPRCLSIILSNRDNTLHALLYGDIFYRIPRPFRAASISCFLTVFIKIRRNSM